MLACVSVGTSVSSVVNSWSCRDETVIRGREDGRGVVDTPTPRAPRGVRTRNPFRRKPGGSRDDAGGFVGREARDAPRGRRASRLNPFTHARVEWSLEGQRADVRARGSEVAAPTLSLLRQFRGAPRGRKRSGGGRSKKSKAAREKICRRPLPKDPKSNISKASNLGAPQRWQGCFVPPFAAGSHPAVSSDSRARSTPARPSSSPTQSSTTRTSTNRPRRKMCPGGKSRATTSAWWRLPGGRCSRWSPRLSVCWRRRP